MIEPFIVWHIMSLRFCHKTLREKQPFYPRKTRYRPISGGYLSIILSDIEYLPWPDPITTITTCTEL